MNQKISELLIEAKNKIDEAFVQNLHLLLGKVSLVTLGTSLQALGLISCPNLIQSTMKKF